MTANLMNWLKLENERIIKMEEAFKSFDFGQNKVLNHTTDWNNKSCVPVYYRTVFVECDGEKMTLDFVVHFKHEDSTEIEDVVLSIYEDFS